MEIIILITPATYVWPLLWLGWPRLIAPVCTRNVLQRLPERHGVSHPLPSATTETLVC